MAALAIAMIAVGSAEAQTDTPEPKSTNVFDRPALADRQREVAALVQLGRVEEAQARLAQLLAAHPDVESLYFLEGLLFAVAGDLDAAIDGFQTAWSLGDRQLRQLVASSQGQKFREDPRVAALLAEADPEPEPPVAVGAVEGIGTVSAATTVWAPTKDRLVSRFTLPKRLWSKPVMTGKSPIAQKLRSLMRTGRSAGLAGVFYDNRDRDHGNMRIKKFPQLAVVEYDAEAKARGIDYGLNTQIVFDAITLGNSSTAIVGNQWRSQGRFGLTQPFFPAKLYQSYRANQIYFFPEHQDHDRISDGGKGDVYPANTPYMLFSQGSSSSELPMMDAVAVILAAIPPKARARLEAEGLISPAVQQIFRRGQAGIMTEEDYLSPRAHPSVFTAAASEPGRMIDLAQEMTEGNIPPMVELAVVSEPRQAAPFAKGLSDQLFTTPSAIARVHRSLDLTRKMELSAAATKDPNGRALRFRWVLLRGDPAKVRIEPSGETGASAEIEIDWHDRFEADGIHTQRVDIGVFAFNGAQWSAPAFLSVSYPPNQRRVYDEAGKLLEVDYRDPDYKARYADPLMFVGRDWRDKFDYNAEGRLIGWTRSRGKAETRFTRHGLKVIESDAQGRPLIAEFVDYVLDRSKPSKPQSVETALSQKARYKYKSDDDTLGDPVLLEPEK